MRARRIALGATLLGLALVACSEITGVNGAGSALAAVRDNPSPIALKPGAPLLVTTHASFWAVQGRETGVRIEYRPTEQVPAGQPFLKFIVPRNVQIVDPTGQALARGDSILIEVQVVPGQLAAKFSPEGLAFTGKTPAMLGIDYLNGEVVDPARQLGIWYEPCDGGAWELQSSRIDRKLAMVVGDIKHFSNYAVAYRK